MTAAPEERHSTHRGRWSELDLPHKGWTCIDTEDLGPEEDGGWITCEMCQCSDIRYAHHMRHPDHDETLRVGCVCAGNMEDNYADAERREKNLKHARRQDWFRFIPGYTDTTNFTAIDEDGQPPQPISMANELAKAQTKAIQGLVICMFRGLVICQAHARDTWAESIRNRSTIPRICVSVISTGSRGLPPTDSPIHWTVISYKLVRGYLARAIAVNRYDMWILDQVPSFDIGTLGRCRNVVTIDRAGRTRFFSGETA